MTSSTRENLLNLFRSMRGWIFKLPMNIADICSYASRSGRHIPPDVLESDSPNILVSSPHDSHPLICKAQTVPDDRMKRFTHIQTDRYGYQQRIPPICSCAEAGWMSRKHMPIVMCWATQPNFPCTTCQSTILNPSLLWPAEESPYEYGAIPDDDRSTYQPQHRSLNFFAKYKIYDSDQELLTSCLAMWLIDRFNSNHGLWRSRKSNPSGPTDTCRSKATALSKLPRSIGGIDSIAIQGF